MSDQKKRIKKVSFSTIPGKLYFPIGEVSKLTLLEPHILRYWEQEFECLATIRRRGNRRYYRPEDVLLIRTIRQLLYEEGYTIKGAQKKMLAHRHNQREQKSHHAVFYAALALENIALELEDNH